MPREETPDLVGIPKLPPTGDQQDSIIIIKRPTGDLSKTTIELVSPDYALHYVELESA